MTPFQAIKASFYMLLAKAREPIQERELARAPAGAAHRPSTTPQSSNSQLTTARTGRRKTDSPSFQHDSIIPRSWKALVAWIVQPHTGTKR
jgi:hypothetical protein